MKDDSGYIPVAAVRQRRAEYEQRLRLLDAEIDGRKREQESLRVQISALNELERLAVPMEVQDASAPADVRS
ncbi:MAG: hypothetical protein ACREJO_03530 [Phycisphaerales bacterium]